MFWLQLSLDVRGKQTLEESLDLYVQGELMEGDNQYFCEEAGQKVGCALQLSLAVTLPALLILCTLRVLPLCPVLQGVQVRLLTQVCVSRWMQLNVVVSRPCHILWSSTSSGLSLTMKL